MHVKVSSDFDARKDKFVSKSVQYSGLDDSRCAT